MSQISDRHTVVPFISGETKAFADQRLAKVGYKKTAKIPNPLPSIAVSVPNVNPEDIVTNLQSLLPHIGTMLENVQDSVIRSLYESSEGTLSSVADSDISVRACISFMEAESNGSRLTAEKIKTWFVSELRDNFSVVIAEKLKLDDVDSPVVTQKLNAYQELFCALSGKQVFMSPGHITALTSAISYAESSESEITEKLVKKLAELSAKPIEELL